MTHRSTLGFAVATGLFAATLLGQGQAPPPQGPQPGQPRSGTALITGHVVDAASGQPVTDALVALGGRGAPPDRVLADPRGRFVFRDLPGGIFSISAAKPGWLGGAVDQHEPTSPGRPIELGDGQRLTGLTLRVWRFGAIDGTVLGDGNEPLAGLEIHALRRALVGGRWMISTGPATSTDDRGHYRIEGLPPGDYVVAVRPSLDPETPLLLAMLTANPGLAADVMAGAMATGRRGPDTDPRVRNYAMTFYPAASSADHATLVTVAAGQERAKVDVHLKLSRVARVSGTLTGITGSAEGITMQLVPAESNGEGGPLDAANAACDESGQFEFSGVAPGRYLVRVSSAPRPPAPGQPAAPNPPAASFDPTWWGGATVTVGAADLSHVAVAAHRTAIVSGHVIFSGGAARPTPAQVAQTALRLDSLDEPATVGAAAWRGQIDPDGQFTMMGVPPGRYLLRAGTAPRWTPQSAMSGGHDILDAPLTIGATNVDDVVLTFTDRPMSGLTGMVRDAGGAGAGASSVLVFPIEKDAWIDSSAQARRLKLARSTETGRYGVGGLPAGEYLVAAVAGEVPAEWQEPSRIDALARSATRVRIERGETHALDLDLMKAAPGNPAAGTATRRAATPAAVRPATSNRTPLKASTPSPGAARARPAAAAPEPERARTAELSGTVVDDSRHQPSPNAIVMLVGTDVALMRVTAADALGRFTFAQLPAGKFLLGAGKSPYLAALYAARRPGRPGTVITLDTGQRMGGVALTLMRGAVVTGRVLDDAGQPVPGARVRVMQHAAAAGEVAMTGDVGDPAGATTNDLGAYRIFDLPPGEYAVAVQARVVVNGDVRRLSEADVDAAVSPVSPPPADPRGRSGGPPAPAAPGVAIGYFGVYFPGTTVPVDAQAIMLAPGEERSNVDLRTTLVRFARIDGAITDAGGPAPANVQMTLRPRGLDASGQLLATLTTRPGPDGRFAFNGVPPGDYTIQARTQPPPAAPGRPLPAAPPPGAPGAGPRWAMRDVSVTGESLTNLTLELQPALAISGRLAVEGLARLPENLPNIRVGVRPTPGSAIPNVPDTALVDRGGRFTLTGLVPGKYRLYLQVPNNDVTQVPEWFPKSAMVDGHDALDVPIDVGPGATLGDALITLTEDTQEVSGTVRDPSGRPSRDCAVVMFPVDRRFWFPQSRRIVFRQSNANGEFVFGTSAGLPAGDYFLAAMPDGRPGEQFDPRSLDELAATAARITLQQGDAKTMDLRIGGGK